MQGDEAPGSDRRRKLSNEVAAPSPPGRSCKYTSFNDSPGSTHRRVVELVPHGARVLEFGCATGYMSQVLRDERGCEVTGVEIDAEAAEQAKAFCKRVIAHDAEALDLSQELGEERFDAIIFADVLEHLRDPDSLLSRVRQFVADGGRVIASIPNVAHGSVRLSLLAGEFRYRPQGLLDDTHLRFFTRATIEDLFEMSGYIVLRWLRQHTPIDGAEIRIADLPDNLAERLAADTDATTYQFVIEAVPSEASQHLAAIRQVLSETRGELGEARSALKEREAAQAELERMRRAHSVLSQRIATERVSMSNRVQELQDEIVDIGHLRDEIEWRKGVSEQLEEANEWLQGSVDRLEGKIAALLASRSFRYTAPLRRIFGLFSSSP